jgi:ubiquinone biosynthesis protein COQ9
VQYAIRCIKHAIKKNLAALEPTLAAQNAYATNLRNSFGGTVWKSGCDAWYLNKDSDVSF